MSRAFTDWNVDQATLFPATAREYVPEDHPVRYRLRKYTVEPVFGQIKEAQGIRRFLLRGLRKVEREWQIICASHNLRKLMKAMA